MSWKSIKRKGESVKPGGTPPNPVAIPPLNASTHGTEPQPAPKADAAESEFDAGNSGVGLPLPQSTAGKDDAVSSEGADVPNDHGGADYPASTGDFSPGKNPLDLFDGEVAAVATYAKHIGESWRRWLQGIMKVARLCADASARLTIAEKSELMLSLPFDEATFSKLVQIGNDARLQKPEIQQLLPPRYTTMYVLTLLTDEELNLAIASKVIHPDLKREELQKWRRSLPRKIADPSSSQDAASDSAVASLPMAAMQDLIESGVSSSTPGPHEIQDKLAVEDDLAASPEHADKESQPANEAAGDDQSIVPNQDADKAAGSIDQGGEFERFRARWEKYLATDWEAMAKETQVRFVVGVLGYPERVK